MQPGYEVTPSVRLVRQLGAGGMGTVWLADHRALHTQVVVKFMAVELATDTSSVARFSREAGAASNVKSPHVVQMLDHGVTREGVPFIVMELLEGEDLSHRVSRLGPIPAQDVQLIVEQVCKALGRAHERGIVHRDIKPDNIYLCNVGGDEIFVKLLDFGIAKAGEGTMGATKTGALIGTPYYMSPEQSIGSKAIDFRTDIWSVGVVTFECLTGVRPFEGDTIGALTLAIHHGPIPAPSAVNANLPPELDAWFARACARNVAERFQSAREMSDAFSAAVRNGPRLSASAVSAGVMPTVPARLPLTTTGAASVSTSHSEHDAPVELPMSRGGFSKFLVGGVVALGVAAAGVFVLRSPATSPASAASAPAAVPAEPAPPPVASPTPVAAPQAEPPPPIPSAAVPAPSASAPESPAATARPPAPKPAGASPAIAKPRVKSAPSRPAAAPAPQPKPTATRNDDIE
jgi:eukaryotic-like serine/threonine-protein kinase